MIRKQIVVAFLCLSAAAGFAQTVTHQPVASQYNNWRANGTTNLVAGANPLVPIASCAITAGGLNTYALAASTPIKINDPGNPAIDEVITPTVVVQGGACTATFTTTNAHPAPWYITSGSGGLQEAINAGTQTGVLNVVLLDAQWHSQGYGASTVGAATGNINVALSDVSISPAVSYKWNGTNYKPTYSLNGVTAAIAAGAAAGTSPTVSNNVASSGNVWTANVTTGTATTTGTLFTETITASPNSSGNVNCTFQVVGANVPPAITFVPTSTTVATFTVASAPAVSTAYIINGTCE
jgi:hypothetical protein